MSRKQRKGAGEDVPSPDEVPQGEQEIPDVAAAVRDATRALQAVFDVLEPPRTIQVEDVYGTVYTVRGSLPARSQILVAQSLDSLFGVDADEAMADDLRAARDQGGVEAVVRVVLGLAADPKVLGAIARAFEVAHPAAVNHAASIAESNGEEYADAADLFAAEELVGGLVPFFVRFGSRALRLLQQVVPQ